MGNFPKFRPKISKLSIVTENWLTWYLKDADSYSTINFLKSDPKIYFWANLGPKRQSCPFCLKIGTHSISRMLILILTLVFWISNSKIYFLANLGQKSQSCAFCLKIGAHGISRMLVFISTFVFWMPNQKLIFGQIWAKKVKFVHFA